MDDLTVIEMIDLRAMVASAVSHGFLGDREVDFVNRLIAEVKRRRPRGAFVEMQNALTGDVVLVRRDHVSCAKVYYSAEKWYCEVLIMGDVRIPQHHANEAEAMEFLREVTS